VNRDGCPVETKRNPLTGKCERTLHMSPLEIAEKLPSLKKGMMQIHDKGEPGEIEYYAMVFADENKELSLVEVGTENKDSFNHIKLIKEMKKKNAFPEKLFVVADYHNHPGHDSGMALSWGDVSAWLWNYGRPLINCVSGNVPYGVGCFVLKQDIHAKRLQEEFSKVAQINKPKVSKKTEDDAIRFFNKYKFDMIEPLWYSYNHPDPWPLDPYKGWKLLKWKGKTYYESEMEANDATAEYKKFTGNKDVMRWHDPWLVESYLYVKERI